MHNTGQAVNGVAGTAGVDIDTPAAWDLHRGDPQIIVTVIDTGADLDHPDLQANLLPRGGEDWDFADTGDPSPDDEEGHGSHVAGTAAAAENGLGVVGVAPRCQIMPLRIDLRAGMNQNRAAAINYVAQQTDAHPARRYVINCSWRTSGDHAGIRNAIVNAVDANVIVNIYSTLPEETYGFLDGTSMAAPHVAGLAALVWSVSPGLTNSQVRQIIEDTCVSADPLNPGFAGLLGRGRINAFRAVELAQFMPAYAPSVPALA